MAIIIDAGIFCAYGNQKDIHHKKAVRIMSEIAKNTYGVETTTDYIMDEVLGVISRKISREKAIEVGDEIWNSMPVTCIDDHLFVKAWFLFKKSKNLSLTDCTILSLMKQCNIEYIATFDKAFKKIKRIKIVGC
jgi:predicted nucleic acid-binding protein